MQWRGRRQSSNIEDRRGSSGGFGGYGRSTGPRIGVPGGRVGRGGGIGIGAIVVILVIGWLTGINPLALLGGGGTGGGPVITSGSPSSVNGVVQLFSTSPAPGLQMSAAAADPPRASEDTSVCSHINWNIGSALFWSHALLNAYIRRPSVISA